MRTIQQLDVGLDRFKSAIHCLLEAQTHVIGECEPPTDPGAYLLLLEDEVIYVGEAKGSAGLRDRILNKHLSGDDSHTLQRHFKANFPDRVARRDHIRSQVKVKWVVIQEVDEVAVVERLAIWLLEPRLNRT